MAGVRFEDVTKRYGTVTVIDHLNLEIRDHEFMVLVGPSGCGKSTALRMIAGLEEISAGKILIGDRVVNDLPPKDRDIAMVFQSYALYPHMTVRQNLDFGLRIRKMPVAEIDAAVDDAAQILGISHLLDRKPKELSGGQRQRVAVGRAIVRHPSVFLFDEPLSNLDAKLRVQMRAELTKLQHRLQTTCVYVTHDQIEAMTMGHRIAVMKDGFLQQVGTPLEVYEKPVNFFVAQFIGTPPMNFLKAQSIDGAFAGNGFRLQIPASLRPVADAASGREVLLGIRPEAVHEKSSVVHGDVAIVQATVDMVEPLGHEIIVHTRIGEEPLVAVFDSHQVPQLGETIDLQIEMNRLHVFDIKDERRITV